MINEQKGEVNFTVKDKNFTVIPTLDFLQRLEQEFGSVYSLFNQFADGVIKISDIIKIVSWMGNDVGERNITDEMIHEEIIDKGAITFYEPLSLFLAMVVAGKNGLSDLSQGLSQQGKTDPKQIEK